MPIPEPNPDPPETPVVPIECWSCGADCSERYFDGYFKDGFRTRIMCPRCAGLAKDDIDSERGEWVE